MNDPTLVVPLEKCYDSPIGYNSVVPDSPAVAAAKVRQAGEWAVLDEEQRQARTTLRARHQKELAAAGLEETECTPTVVVIA